MRTVKWKPNNKKKYAVYVSKKHINIQKQTREALYYNVTLSDIGVNFIAVEKQ